MTSRKTKHTKTITSEEQKKALVYLWFTNHTNSISWLFKRTALLEFSYSAWMVWTRPSSVFKLLGTCQRPTCQTLSNAFLKSVKLQNRSRWCCRCFFIMTQLLRICSTVLWPGLKPACSPASSSSALSLNRLKITRSTILLGWLIRLMVW